MTATGTAIVNQSGHVIFHFTIRSLSDGVFNPKYDNMLLGGAVG